MENKINIAELLRDCPQGMELDCTMFEGIEFDSIVNNDCFPILCRMKNSNDKYNFYSFTKYGYWNDDYRAKCVIFPKGKTTWEGFVPPCKFNAGDVLVSETGNIVLFSHIDSKGAVHYHCIIPDWGSFRIEENTSIGVGRYYDCILANEEQRQRMYDKIKCSGYKYNQQLNKLEKLVKPKFKVGDNIVKRNCINNSWIISSVSSEYYGLKLPNNSDSIGVLPVSDQDDYELVPNKFDITTLKPFESRVLVRHNRDNKWCGSFFSHIDEDFHSHCYKFVTTAGKSYPMCIPYNEDTKHLIGTPNDCDEYYKTWE